jgi:hypothetical protein
MMSTKAGIKRYSVFAALVKDLEPSGCSFIAMGAPQASVPTVTDDENWNDESAGTTATSARDKGKDEDVQPEQIDFEEKPNVPGILIENNKPLNSDKDGLYGLHVRAGHSSFSKLWAMARHREVPSKLQLRIPGPQCREGAVKGTLEQNSLHTYPIASCEIGRG